MARKAKAKKTNKISVNFKGVETRVMLPENDYLLSVVSVESEDEQARIGLQVEAGKFKGKKVTEYFSLKPQALWRLGNFLAACGLDVPDDELDIDLDTFDGVTVMGVCTHEEYEGKQKMRWDFYGADEADAEEADEDEDEDEDDKKSSKPKGKSKKVDPVSADEVNGADEDELGSIIEATGIDVDLDEYKGIKKKRAAVLEALTDADLLAGDEEAEEEADEDEEEEEEEKPKGKRGRPAKEDKKAGKKAKKVDSSDVEDMDEDALGELVEEHELDVDLDDYKTLRKKVRAVLDALEEKGLLEE